MFLGGVATINHLTYQNINVSTLQMFAGIYRDLQGLCRGFLQYLQGKPCNIYRFSLQYLQIAEIAGKIFKYYRMFPADIAENPCRVPVNPCKHLQCSIYLTKPIIRSYVSV
jgi:hypothetical protein